MTQTTLIEYAEGGDLLVTTGDQLGNRVFGYTALGQLAGFKE